MGTDDIIGHDLKAFEVAVDGSCFRLRFSRPDGSLATLRLPGACLQSLALTLPKMMLEAVRAQNQDESLRLVYPAQTVRVEQAQAQDTTILTLVSPDGFEVSFGLTPAQVRAVSRAHEAGEAARAAPEQAAEVLYN